MTFCICSICDHPTVDFEQTDIGIVCRDCLEEEDSEYFHEGHLKGECSQCKAD